jgi:putative flippase GtrA
LKSISFQFLLYLACSAAAAMANLLVGFAIVNALGFTSRVQYPIAVAIGYCAGMAINFLLNRRFTFEGSDRSKLQQARTFLVVALSGLLLTSTVAAIVRAALSGLASGASLPLSAETIGQLVAIGVVSVYSFVGHRFLTFNRGIRFQLLKIVKPGSAGNADG